MKVALLVVGFSKGGIQEATKTTTLTLAKEIKNQGHDPIIISDGREGSPRYEIVEGIKVFRPYKARLVDNPLFRLINHTVVIGRGVRYVEKKLGIKFDIIHNFSSAPLAAIRGYIARGHSKKNKLIHTIKSHSKSKLGGYDYSKVLNGCNAITTLTETNKRLLIQNGCEESKIEIIHSHIDTKKFKPLNKKTIRKKYNIPQNKKVITYFGPLHERKGTRYLFKAIPAVLKKYPNALFIFLCKTPTYNKRYDQLINKLNIKESVRIIKEKVNLVEYLNLSDTVVLPYPHLIATESNPSCLLESMACKIPVVTSDLSEINDIVKNEKEVLTARPRDTEDLANKIIQILSDKKLREEIIKNAFKKSKMFDVKRIAREYITLYDKLIPKNISQFDISYSFSIN